MSVDPSQMAAFLGNQNPMSQGGIGNMGSGGNPMLQGGNPMLQGGNPFFQLGNPAGPTGLPTSQAAASAQPGGGMNQAQRMMLAQALMRMGQQGVSPLGTPNFNTQGNISGSYVGR